MKRLKFILVVSAAVGFISVSLSGAGLLTVNNRIEISPTAEISPGVQANTDSAVVIKPDFMINSLTGPNGADQVYASAACDSSGNFGITWIDYRSGKPEIYAQFYNSAGEKRGNNIRVSDYLFTYSDNSPCISVNKKGDFIIVWSQNYNSAMAQRFTYTGEKTGMNFPVNSIGMNSIQNPNVVVNEDGSYLVSWSGQSDSFNLYVRLFKPDNTPAFAEYAINEKQNISAESYGRRAAVDGEGNYVIVWSAPAQDNQYDIYLQKINKDGNKVDSNIIVSGLYNAQNKRRPQVACTEDGHCLITWYTYATESVTGGYRARIYNIADSFVTGNIDLSSYSSAYDLGISSNRKNIFLLLYSDEKGHMLDTLGKTKGVVTQLNFSDSPLEYPMPVVTDIVNGVFYGVVRFPNNNDADVYFKRFDERFNPAGDFEKVNDDIAGSSQKKPFVYYNNKGGSLVLWEDTRNGKVDLYGQVYDEFQNPLGENLLVFNAPSINWYLNDKAVRALSDGTFVIAFTGNENYYASSTYLKMISPDGKLTGTGRLVGSNNDYYSVKLNINTNDDILVCWYNNYYSFARKYNKNGFELSPAIKLGFGSDRKYVAAAVDTSLNVLLAWSYSYYDSPGFGKIYTEIYNSAGKTISDSVMIASPGSYPNGLTCALDCENYAVAWRDYVLNIYRKYTVDGNYITYNFRDTRNIGSDPRIIYFENSKIITSYRAVDDEVAIYLNDNKESTAQFKLYSYDPYAYMFSQLNCSAVYKSKLFFVYEKVGDTTAYDIWGRVLDLDGFNQKDESFYFTRNDDYLFNNYPNPFNGSTTIPYKLLSPYHVKLTVYDILGREVKVLVDEFQEKGIYEVELDASGLASGVYVYKLDAFKSYVKKLIIMK